MNNRQFWSKPVEQILQELQTSLQGLSNAEADERLSVYGANRIKPHKGSGVITLLVNQFKSPIILILILAALLSVFLHDRIDALIILVIVIVSGLLGFWQERGASNAVEKLLAMVQIRAAVRRNNATIEIPHAEIVPGDIVELSAGSGVPGDCVILDCRDLFVDEAALTGETYPVEKMASEIPADTPLAQRRNVLYMGTHVVSGTAVAVVVQTGINTEFGRVSSRLSVHPQETEFERGVRRFGYLLMEVTLILLIGIFAINVYMHRHVLDAFMFSLALAVGLTPQLLPAIISVNLAHGAKRMARGKVIVKKLASIENLGSMNVLCSDKTGTLTEGVVRLYQALDVDGAESEQVLLYAYINSKFETGFANPIDEAIRNYRQFDISSYQKLDEHPYDFVRKRLSILIAGGDRHLLLTKGALANVLAVCSNIEKTDGTILEIEAVRQKVEKKFEDLSADGNRVLGLAYKDLGGECSITKAHEDQMTFLGFLVFFDPPKQSAIETIQSLADMGVTLKMITGDNRLVAGSVARQVGISNPEILTGQDLREMSDEALQIRINRTHIFAEVEPNQKERILLAAKKAGNVVGYMGDGINDASALHAADVGISVDGAVDVAKEAADIVLLEKDLSAIISGVRGGRTTFANTMKYVFMATSANFGNMFSMAGASLFLPFLPLLPQQILLMNLLTDFPEMTIAGDSVDPEMLERPQRWNISFIRKFMVTFGILSSVFDFLTFGILLFILKAGTDQFRTGWFVESVVSACLIVLVIRSRRPFFRIMPSRLLLLSTHAVVGLTILMPFTPLSAILNFAPLPSSYLLILGAIIILYIVAAELTKAAFYRHINAGTRRF
jgi:P-type Mg2+ transporter